MTYQYLPINSASPFSHWQRREDGKKHRLIEQKRTENWGGHDKERAEGQMHRVVPRECNTARRCKIVWAKQTYVLLYIKSADFTNCAWWTLKDTGCASLLPSRKQKQLGLHWQNIIQNANIMSAEHDVQLARDLSPSIVQNAYICFDKMIRLYSSKQWVFWRKYKHIMGKDPFSVSSPGPGTGFR